MGGYIAGRENLCDAIRSYAHGFIFTSYLSPCVAAGAATSVRYLKEHNELRVEHQRKAQVLKDKFASIGLPIVDHGSHIIPVIVGNPIHTKIISDNLLEDYGIYAQPINFPTVPRGTERLRFTPSPVHSDKQIDDLVNAMDTLWSHCELQRFKKIA